MRYTTVGDTGAGIYAGILEDCTGQTVNETVLEQQGMLDRGGIGNGTRDLDTLEYDLSIEDIGDTRCNID